jgi:hypothetical protein
MSVVVKDAFIYHHNPDTAREVLWRNFWIGRSVLRAHKPKDVLIMAAKRLIDISPPAALLILFTGHFLFQGVGVALIGAFVFAIARHRVLEAESVRGRLILKLFYVPAYRFLRVLVLSPAFYTRLPVVVGPELSRQRWLDLLRSLLGKGCYV